MKSERKETLAKGRASSLRSEPAPRQPAAFDRANVMNELLQLSLELPVEAPELHLIELCVDRLSRLLPELAVGARIAQPEGSPLIVLGNSARTSHEEAETAERLFPDLAHERSIELPKIDDSTLHVAAGEVTVLAADSLESEIIDCTARILACAIERARAFQSVLHARSTHHQQERAPERLTSLGQIVAGVVHELKNPLTSIVAYSDYLRKKTAARGDDSEDVERLRRISEAAERISKFSRDLVEYARPASEVFALVDLPTIIEKALVFCEHEFDENEVYVEREIAPELPPVHGIAGQLTQVFVNLFTNAAHAMAGGGGTLRVVVRLDDSAETLLIDIADQGIGIDSRDLEQIFEPFFTTKTDGRGTGLGLSIVREIVASHGGSLRAQSRPQQGAVFSLGLPLAPR